MTSAPEAQATARPADLRMARLHLRLGSLELARAELEAFAGAGALDADALVDLAEVRWRTGDISGAGVAAQAFLGEGGDAVLALVIAAEASAAMGRSSEARLFAGQALERSDVPLERLFAGIARSGVWPMEPDERPEPAGELFALPARRPGPSASREATAADEAVGLGELSAPVVPGISMGATSGLWDEPEREASLARMQPGPDPDPAAQLVAARTDIAAGRLGAAGTRLAVVLRLAPSLAPAVLEAVAGVRTATGSAAADLELVRGDAFRLVGREVEARRSYAAAAAALRPDEDAAG